MTTTRNPGAAVPDGPDQGTDRGPVPGPGAGPAPSSTPPDDEGHLRYLLTAYLFEQISEAGRREVEEHLASCAECRAELESLRGTLAQVQAALAPEAGPEGEGGGAAGEPYSFEARRLERVLQAARARRRGGWNVYRGWGVAALAACALLVVVLGLVVPTQMRGRASRASFPAGGVAVPGVGRQNVSQEAPALARFAEHQDAGAAATPVLGDQTVMFIGGQASTGPAAVEVADATSAHSVQFHVDDSASRVEAPLSLSTTDQVEGLVTAFEWDSNSTASPPPAAARGDADNRVTRVDPGYRVISVTLDSDPGTPQAESAAATPPAAAAPVEGYRMALLAKKAHVETVASPPPPAEPAEQAPRAGADIAAQVLGERGGKTAEKSGAGSAEVTELAAGLDKVPVKNLSPASPAPAPAAPPAAAVASPAGAPPAGGKEIAQKAKGHGERRTRDRRPTEIVSLGGQNGASNAADGRSRTLDRNRTFDDRPKDAAAKDQLGDHYALGFRAPQSLDFGGTGGGGARNPLEPPAHPGALTGATPGAGGGGGGASRLFGHNEAVPGKDGSVNTRDERLLQAGGGQIAAGDLDADGRTDLAFQKQRAPVDPAAIRKEEALRREGAAAERWAGKVDEKVVQRLEAIAKPGPSNTQLGAEALEAKTKKAPPDQMFAAGGRAPAAAPEGALPSFGWYTNTTERFHRGDSQPLDPGLEPSLRALAYYRSADQGLTREAVLARKLFVPAPTVGDEGLGEAEFRARYGTNPFVEAARDHLSTFGMDVDTASYALARNFLRSGKLPDPMTVRVEEVVNSFRDERAADPARAFTVWCEGGPSPFGAGLELLEITVKARELRPNERKPALLTFAVDASGSMHSSGRLELARSALETLAGSLEPDDRVGVVAFSDHAYLALPHTPARERARILDAVRSLAPRGGTNVEAGLDLAYRAADEAFEKRSVNRVVLCSDGVANAGARGPEELLRKVEVFARRGIYLSCVGFGMGKYNDKLLETLADKGNGNYAYVDSSEAAAEIFRKSLPSTLQVLAEDAKIQVDFNPEAVTRYRLLGYENRDIADAKFRDDKVDAGEVGPGTTVTVLYEVQRKPAGSGELGRIHIRHRDAGTRRVEEADFPLPPGAMAAGLRETSDRFRLLACVAELAELLRESYWARDGSYGRVLEVVEGLSPAYRARPEVAEVAELAWRAQVLTVTTLYAKAERSSQSTQFTTPTQPPK
ncbi:MAG: von Willebrand factor type A domain-containing protein [Planctomycetes bacterium]|nr:von Willebrand factor type A domain-containing protein [Planctomycetota bacterium]